MPEITTFKKFSKFFGWIFFLVGLDQFSKYLFLRLSLNPVFLEKNFFHFFIQNPVCNVGITWGVEIKKWPFTLLWVLAFTLIIWQYQKTKSFYLLLVIAGAISNLLDRFFKNCVIDFIRISSFPVFNLADIFISGGCFLFLFFHYLKTNSKTNFLSSR